MSHDVGFEGVLEFPDAEALRAGLERLECPPDDDEPNLLSRAHLKLDGTTAAIDYRGSMPASHWYGCRTALFKLAHGATRGQIQCLFEGRLDTVVRPGKFPP